MQEDQEALYRAPFGQIHTRGNLIRIVRPSRDSLTIDTDTLSAIHQAKVKATSLLVGHGLEGGFEGNIDLTNVVLKRDLRRLFRSLFLRLLQVITTRPKRKKSHRAE